MAPVVRAALLGVRARAHAAVGDVARTAVALGQYQRQLDKASLVAESGWLARMAQPDAPVYAATGHVWAVLAASKVGVGERDTRKAADLAIKRLTESADALDRRTYARSHALVVARLALAYQGLGDDEQAARLGSMARQCAETTRSARLDLALSRLTV